MWVTRAASIFIVIFFYIAFSFAKKKGQKRQRMDTIEQTSASPLGYLLYTPKTTRIRSYWWNVRGMNEVRKEGDMAGIGAGRGTCKRVAGFRGHLHFSWISGILGIYNSFKRKMHIGFYSTLNHWKLLKQKLLRECSTDVDKKSSGDLLLATYKIRSCWYSLGRLRCFDICVVEIIKLKKWVEKSTF